MAGLAQRHNDSGLTAPLDPADSSSTGPTS